MSPRSPRRWLRYLPLLVVAAWGEALYLGLEDDSIWRAEGT